MLCGLSRDAASGDWRILFLVSPIPHRAFFEQPVFQLARPRYSRGSSPRVQGRRLMNSRARTCSTLWASARRNGPDGEPFAASGARTSVRDLARIGQDDATWRQGRRARRGPSTKTSIFVITQCVGRFGPLRKQKRPEITFAMFQGRIQMMPVSTQTVFNRGLSRPSCATTEPASLIDTVLSSTPLASAEKRRL
jgi:hypothetical protein